MISGRERLSCNDFGDCHDKIIVAGVDFIGRRPICGLYLPGEGCFRALPTWTTTLGHRSVRRWSRRVRFGGDVSASYVVSDDATVDIL